MSDKPKWEHLNTDCLVNIFGRLEVEYLLLDVPFVCKSWYQASKNPLCWRLLDFRPLDPVSNTFFYSRLLCEDHKYCKFHLGAVIKFIIKRSNGFATLLVLPSSISYEEDDILLYIANECPNLRVLGLPDSYDIPHFDEMFPNLVSKWKNLETLTLGSSNQLEEVIAQIGIHCKNFVGLVVTQAYSASGIGTEVALSIVTHLPNLKKLDISDCFIDRESVMIILRGCKQLEYLHVGGTKILKRVRY